MVQFYLVFDVETSGILLRRVPLQCLFYNFFPRLDCRVGTFFELNMLHRLT